MIIKTLGASITEHPFFHGMNPEHLAVLAECASEKQFKPGEVLFREGEPANQFYLIASRRVTLEAHEPADGTVPVQTLGTGEVLGWSWLFPPFAWPFTACAIEPCEIVAFGAISLREKAEENHDFGYDLMRRVSQVMLVRLQSTRRKLVKFYGVIE